MNFYLYTILYIFISIIIMSIVFFLSSINHRMRRTAKQTFAILNKNDIYSSFPKILSDNELNVIMYLLKDGLSTKDASNLLGLSQEELERVFLSALEKINSVRSDYLNT